MAERRGWMRAGSTFERFSGAVPRRRDHRVRKQKSRVGVALWIVVLAVFAYSFWIGAQKAPEEGGPAMKVR
jgi:hypothetical protein